MKKDDARRTRQEEYEEGGWGLGERGSVRGNVVERAGTMKTSSALRLGVLYHRQKKSGKNDGGVLLVGWVAFVEDDVDGWPVLVGKTTCINACDSKRKQGEKKQSFPSDVPTLYRHDETLGNTCRRAGDNLVARSQKCRWAS